jgi:hypothetical protein
MLQFAPIARVVPQLFANTHDPGSAPVKLMLVILRTAEPVFVMVTACDALDDPTATVPNDRLVADKLTTG